MEFPYTYDYSYTEPAIEGAVGFVLVFLLLFYLLLLGLGVISYVLQSVSMYTIAKRRGIRHPWLSWLPVGNMWILGSISDQYQFVAKGKVRNRRKVLVGLTAAMLLLLLCVCVMIFASAIAEAAAMDAGEMLLGASLAVALLGYLTILVISVVAVVFQYIALYDLYASCDPNNAAMFLVLSIFFSITMPFFVFACRKKDRGMPPRKIEVPVQKLEEQAPPVEETEE